MPSARPPRPARADGRQQSQGIEGLILRACRHLALHSHVGEETFHLSFSECLRMLFAVKEDELLDPPHVGLFGAWRVMFDSKQSADLGRDWRLRVRHIIERVEMKSPTDEPTGGIAS